MSIYIVCFLSQSLFYNLYPFESNFNTDILFQVLELNEKDSSAKLTCLGPNPIGTNQLLQYTVPPNVWFGAFPTQDIIISSENGAVKTAPRREPEEHFSLVGCTCAPAFQFEDFELARRSELISCFPKHESLINMLTFAE